ALQALPAIIDRAGIVPLGVLAEIRVDETAAFLPLRPMLGLLQRAAARSGDMAIGVRLAEAGRPARPRAFGRPLPRAPALGGAIERACCGIDWLRPGARLRLQRDGSNLLWQAELPPRLGADGRVAKSWLLALLRLVLRAAAGRSWRPLALRCEQGERLEA